MSDVLAVATVTRALVQLLSDATNADLGDGLQDALRGTTVTSDPPESARDPRADRQLNVFLYHTEVDTAWSNAPMPTAPDDSGTPPLALTLHYLLTAYGGDDQGLIACGLLALHDHPVLGPKRLRATGTASNLHRQLERVRITPLRRSDADMSSLWMTLQTPRCTSAVFTVGPVLIESRRPSRAPLPVAARGDKGDLGATVSPNLESPIPTLLELEPPTASAGATLMLRAHRLSGDAVRLRFTHPMLDAPVLSAPLVAPATGAFSAALPADVPAGVVGVAAQITIDKRQHATAELALRVRPTITDAELPLHAARDAHGDAHVTVSVAPAVIPGQEALLLIGDRHQIRADPITAPTSRLTFRFPATAGTLPMRIRVGGIDSALITDTTPRIFDPKQSLVVT